MQFPPPRSVSPFRNNLTPNLNNQFVPSQPLQNLAGRTSPILGPSYPPNQPIGFPPGMPINSGFIESARPNIINGPRSPMPINPLNNGFPMRLQPGIHQDIPIGYPSMGGIASMPMGAVPIGTSGPFRNGFQRPQPSYIGYKILDRFP
jgi:hypothetical protein